MTKSFVREKRIEAGPLVEITLFQRTIVQELRCKEPRKRRKPISRPAQMNWNDQRSKKYAKYLIYANFCKGDYYLTFTYHTDHLPKTPDDAKKDQENYLRKMKRRYKKANIEFKYMWFTSFQFDDDTGYIKRIHHHVLINAGIGRDEAEQCWSKGSGKKREYLGRTQARIIQPGMNGLEDLAVYLTAQEKWENRQWKKGQKRWSSSKNLVKPFETKNDHKWSKRKLERVGRDENEREEIILKMFPNHILIGDIVSREYDDSGWHVQATLLKIDNHERSG